MLDTKLIRINELSTSDHKMVFKQLMHHFDVESLLRCYQQLDGKAAVGSDGITKEKYGENLIENIHNLVGRLKQMAYKPNAVRQVMIPKEGKRGATRPLGIGNFEDKLVQKRMQDILEAIFDPLFLSSSFGFRTGLGCHDAVKALRDHLYHRPVYKVIDLDLSNYFGTINHDKLMAMIERKIQDKRFIRYLKRMLKAGLLEDGKIIKSDTGVPQGNIASPVLANIYAHFVLDEWFEKVVKSCCRGEVKLIRYADDAVICCTLEKDATRIKEAMGKRLKRFDLSMNEEKTHVVTFSKAQRLASSTFDFLGFTFYVGITKGGKSIPKVKSSGKKIKAKLVVVNEWCRKYKNKYRLAELWKIFCTKLEGHIQYYGVSFNSKMVNVFLRKAQNIFWKWMNRRSQRNSMTMKKFNDYRKLYPPPYARVCQRLF